MSPKVSFIVPCYRLAHLLPDCVDSILKQSFGDFEILIMDDCSPDDTPKIAASFGDPRVIHVRNEPNLGHLRNYNKGISLARGEYIWLISADDYLRRPYILERYVKLFDEHPQVGYVFCPGVQVRGGKEGTALDYSFNAGRDSILNGRKFLKTLLRFNTVLAASGCVRRACYEQISVFPLDMPWVGDWYLWASFAFSYDVGYLSEPMVCYREHELSMTTKLMKEELAQCSAESLTLPWTFKRKAEEAGDKQLVRGCLDAAACHYAWRIVEKNSGGYPQPMTFEQVEDSLRQNTASEAERRYIRGKIDAFIADEYYCRGDAARARHFYVSALRKAFWTPKVWAKYMLISCGSAGNALRMAWRSRHVRRTTP